MINNPRDIIVALDEIEVLERNIAGAVNQKAQDFMEAYLHGACSGGPTEAPADLRCPIHGFLV